MSRITEQPAVVATWIDLLQERAAEHPARPAYTFLRDGEAETARLTYGDLEMRARALAGELQSRGARPGQRVLLLQPPGIEFITAFFGSLFAGMVAVPSYPPRSSGRKRTTDARLEAIARDARPQWVSATGALMGQREALSAQVPELAAAQWLAEADVSLDAAVGWQEPVITGETIALLQYTSGSTSTPKGVVVTHANLLHNEETIQRAFGQSADSVIVGWLPLYHDMGLIGNVLQPLYIGAHSVLMSPMSFLMRPKRWLAAISHYRATTSGGPNFAYDLCVRKIPEAQREGLDLSSWNVAFNGSEPVRADTMRRFATEFASCGFDRRAFFPCYGLAEATLFVTGGGRGEGPIVDSFDAKALERGRAYLARGSRLVAEPRPSQLLVGSGRPRLGQTVRIVEPETSTELGEGHVGEIWLAGPSTAQGYWRRPEETARDFAAALVGSADRRFLRTGDLGFLHQGELYVTGRLKDLIIIRGRNHYPQDLERSAELCHSDLSPGGAAAVAVEAEGGERLVMILELERRRQAKTDVDDVARAVRQAVAEEHEAQVHDVVLIRAGTLPRTSSGKVQRRACAAAYLAGELAVVGSRRVADVVEVVDEAGPELVFDREAFAALAATERGPWIESLLCQRLAKATRIDTRQIDPELPLTAAGLDSLMAVELKNDLDGTLGIGLSFDQLLAGSSLAELGREVLAELQRAESEPQEPVPAPIAVGYTGPDEAPLSHGQQALWLLQRLAPESAAYHVTFAARIRSELQAAALRRVAEGWLERHPSLRANFHTRDGKPFQRFTGELFFEEIDACGWDREQLAIALDEAADRSFDLETGPVFRLHLFERVGDDAVLLIVAHHAVIDLWSLQSLLAELGSEVRLAAASQPADATLAPGREGIGPTVHPAEIQRWQSEQLAGPHGEALWRYWHEALADAEQILELPTDRPRPPVTRYHGAALPCRLGRDLTAKLEELARGRGATAYMVMLAAFQALLNRHSGQEDLLVGSPLAGRTRPELADVVGYFVNPLPIRGDLSDPQEGPLTFAGLLDRVRERVAGALAHQDYPAPLLVEKLAPQREANRNPLFQVLFTLERPRHAGDELAAFLLCQEGATVDLGGLHLESVNLTRRWSQFDLTLRLVRSGEGLLGEWIYATDLFDASTIRRMMTHYEMLLGAILERPDAPLCEASMLHAGERQQLLTEWNAGGSSPLRKPDSVATLARLFVVQAATTPDATALIAGTERLSYAELDRRSGALARQLSSLGVGPEVLVGVFLERSPWLVLAILGTLKAGGAYVPLDPTYPQERLRLMLEESRAPVILTQTTLLSRLPQGSAQALCLDRECLDRECLDREALDRECLGRDLDPPGGSLPSRRLHPDHLAYVIYTSGSTGRPKGVAITHRNAVAMLDWARREFPRQRTTGILAATSVCFDLSVFELFLPLVRGGKVVLADSAFHLQTLPAAAEVTLVNTVPSAIIELARRKALPASVRTVNLAGEALRRNVVDATYTAASVDAVYNLYGPSEDTTYSTWERVPAGTDESPAIGRPIERSRAFLLDRHHQPVPTGVIGELVLGGAGITRGYLRRPGATAERFLPDSLSGIAGERLYRTGDLARYRPDGRLDYLGRIDHQIKLRGFRIELGEIETAITGHAQVEETVVTVQQVAGRAGETGVDRLVAHVAAPGYPELSSRELADFIRQSLPDYMIPSVFVVLETFPRLPNGKIDRSKLPEPEAQRPELAGSFIAPSSELARQLAEIWQEVLGLERVGVDDSFFDLGGHSLLMAQVHDRIEKLVGRQIPIVELFQFPTIRSLERHLSGSTEAQPSFDAVRQRAERKRRLPPPRSRRPRGR